MLNESELAAAKPPFPARPLPQVATDLAVPRAKSRSLILALGYRTARLGIRVFGLHSVLRFCLEGAWVFRRFAYELSAHAAGEAFQNTTHALTDQVLREWVPKQGRALDIGCGNGRICRLVASYADRAVGIDRDQSRIELARRMTSASNVEYRVADVTTGEGLQGETFDVALLVHVLEHIDDTDELLHAISAVAPRLLVEVPDFDSDCLNLVRRDFDCKWYTDNDHVREYTVPILKSELERNGWAVRAMYQRGGMMLAVAECQLSQ